MSIWAKVDRRGDHECWPWLGRTNHHGYGTIGVHLAHRRVYAEVVGEIPDGMQIDHACHPNDGSCAGGVRCEHRKCCNPAHLRPATPGENTRRGLTGQRSRERKLAITHCPQGHRYAGDNLYVKPSGQRECRACHRDIERRRRSRGTAAA